ncbi:MAG: 4'-phosphopantetheinyl transferase superfamily protein, partial [Candidatus Riflebacteria bacterium]|nr:4'-phosphopantetheinyl transferase superfamily protein [Candidatus Riflebacteria bacterium]
MLAGSGRPPPLAVGQLQVFTLAFPWRLPEERVAPLVDLLAPDETIRASRLAQRSRRVEYVLGKLLTRRVLAFHGGLAAGSPRFVARPGGKPELPGMDLGFNLSHKRGLLALAVARGAEVGVDVETVQGKDPKMAHRVFAPPEIALVESIPRERRALAFTVLWTLKESYIKARGKGLSIPLGSFHFTGELASRLGEPGAHPACIRFRYRSRPCQKYPGPPPWEGRPQIHRHGRHRPAPRRSGLDRL